ncbi:hypothetical protein ACLKA7_003083 [Drosophila subpalustris]
MDCTFLGHGLKSCDDWILRNSRHWIHPRAALLATEELKHWPAEPADQQQPQQQQKQQQQPKPKSDDAINCNTIRERPTASCDGEERHDYLSSD